MLKLSIPPIWLNASYFTIPTLLNEKNSGFILNSVHSTEGCYTYIKEIKSGSCEIDLSNEEKKALSQAMSKS